MAACAWGGAWCTLKAGMYVGVMGGQGEGGTHTHVRRRACVHVQGEDDCDPLGRHACAWVGGRVV